MPYTIGIDARKVQDFGIGTYIRNLVWALSEIDRENRYLLLTGVNGREAFAGLPENFETVHEKSPVYSARELIALSWKLHRLELDLYHATHYVLPALVSSPVVVTIHDIIHLLFPEFLPNRLAFLYAQRMIRRSLKRGERVIAVSNNTREDLMSAFGLGGSKIKVVYNGVEDLFREQLDEDSLQRWLDRLELKRPYLLFVGNPKPHKNLDRVIQAFAKARKLANFDGQLVCVGDRGNAEFKIMQRAELLGISDSVKLLGHVAKEALPAIYQGASVFLYPTLYEGFGLPVVEAMASGTAVITSSTSALKEIAGRHAALVDPLDVDAMAQAIVRVMKDDEYRTRLETRGLERASEFTWKRAAEATLEIYLDAIHSARDKGIAGWRRRQRVRRAALVSETGTDEGPRSGDEGEHAP